MLKVCLKIWEFERKFRVWKEWIRVIGNDWGAIGIKGVENKALRSNASSSLNKNASSLNKNASSLKNKTHH